MRKKRAAKVEPHGEGWRAKALPEGPHSRTTPSKTEAQTWARNWRRTGAFYLS
jgi:hypothetical protein